MRKMNQTLNTLEEQNIPRTSPEFIQLWKILKEYLDSEQPLYGHIYSPILKKYIVYELPVNKKYNIVIRISDSIEFTTSPP